MRKLSHRHEQSVWETAKAEARTSMIECAKRKRTIAYSEFVKTIHAITFEAHDQNLTLLLCEISQEEDSHGRGMLSAVVVQKAGDKTPGKGFFDLAKQLGRRFNKDDEFWALELGRVFDYWSANSKE